jgi:hypothetical protein
MYVDESGDVGTYIPGKSQNSKHFILSELIVSQDDWLEALDRLSQFRKMIKEKYGLLMKEEIHTSELFRISKMKSYKSIRKSDRVQILRLFMQDMPVIFPNSKVINICLNKVDFLNQEVDFMELAWRRLIQRYDTFLKKEVNDKGIIISDSTNSDLTRRLVRQMRKYNPTPSYYGGSYNPVTDSILEDPFPKDSKHSYFIQAVDAIAHCLYRKEYPKGSLKKFGVQYFFDKLLPILLLEASKKDPFGVVRK